MSSVLISPESLSVSPQPQRAESCLCFKPDDEGPSECVRFHESVTYLARERKKLLQEGKDEDFIRHILIGTIWTHVQALFKKDESLNKVIPPGGTCRVALFNLMVCTSTNVLTGAVSCDHYQKKEFSKETLDAVDQLMASSIVR